MAYARVDDARVGAAQLAQLLDSAISASASRQSVLVEHSPHPDHAAGSDAMSRFAAQLASAESEEEPAEAGADGSETNEVHGLASRIHSIYGDSPEPPPTTVWGSALLKDS